MTGPGLGDGAARGAGQFLQPPVGVIIAVAVTDAFLGGIAAGFVYLGLTVTVLGGIYVSAKNWHIPYTAGFLVSAVFMASIIPDIVSEMVHPVFGWIGTFSMAVFLVLMAGRLMQKIGLDELLHSL